MRRKVLWVLPVLLVVGLIIKYWSWPIVRNQAVGTYLNTNYCHDPCCIEAPHRPDTLRLMSDGTMASGFFGKGTWELRDYCTKVLLKYPYEFGTAGLMAGIDNEIGGPIRLVLQRDWDHHYRKIE